MGGIEIKHVAISDLREWPQNPRKNERAASQLAKLIKTHGFNNPIVATPDGTIRAGHTRFKAAKELGLNTVPVVFVDFKSEAQAQAYALSDNKSQEWAEWDVEELTKILEEIMQLGDVPVADTGFTEEELEKLGVAKPEPGCDEDEVPEVKPDPRTSSGELWILGNHRLMIGDCTVKENVERLMAGEKADMVFTDPPYGVDVENTQGKIMGDDSLDTFLACLPILKEIAETDAHFYVWCASGDRLPPSLQAFAATLPFQNLLPVRCTHENKRGPKGAFKYNYEVCLFGNDNTKSFRSSRKFPVSETTLRDERYKGDGYLKVYPALWDGERATEHNMNIVHPTQKNVGMVEFYVEISSSSGEAVADLFLGSGSTLIACEKTNRRCFGMEIDPAYCDVIIERWQKYTGKKAQREDGKSYDEFRAN